MRVGFALALLLLLAAAPAHAGLIGSTVNVSAYFPDSITLFEDPGDAVVSSAIEYPAGSYPDYNTVWEIDVSDTQVIVTEAGTLGLPFNSADFNGWILKVVSGPSIVSASLDPSSGLTPVVSVVGGDLLMNFQGITTQTGPSAVINFAVPEPSAGVLLLAGLLGTCIRARLQRSRGV